MFPSLITNSDNNGRFNEEPVLYGDSITNFGGTVGDLGTLGDEHAMVHFLTPLLVVLEMLSVKGPWN